MDELVRSVCYVSREFGNLVGVGGVKDLAKGVCVAAAEYGLDAHVFLLFPDRAPEMFGLKPCEPPMQLVVRMDCHRRYRRTELVEVLTYEQPGLPKLRYYFIKATAQYIEGKVPRRGIYVYTPEEAEELGQPRLAGQVYGDLFDSTFCSSNRPCTPSAGSTCGPTSSTVSTGIPAFCRSSRSTGSDEYAHFLGSTPTLATVPDPTDHYRGEVPYDEFVAAVCGVPEYIIRRCLHDGNFDPVLIAGLFGSGINTVSENFAWELRRTGLDWRCGWLIHRLAGYGIELRGISIGIDPREFDPALPKAMHTAAAFSPANDDFAGKLVCKQSLLRTVGLGSCPADTPILSFVGRLVHHKGFDVLTAAILRLFQEDDDIVLIGNGGGYPEVIDMLRGLQQRFPDRIRIGFRFDLPLGNQIFAGGDFCLIPSLYEAGGTVDMIASLFGNIPVVRAVGGLVKVIDGQNGFSYQGGAEEFYHKLRQVIQLYRTDRDCIHRIQVSAARNVLSNFTWTKIFQEKYIHFYNSIIGSTTGNRGHVGVGTGV